MAWMKPHQWVDQPHTMTERMRAMNVRESRHTAMLFNPKHYDVETGKFITDKLPTIASYNGWDFVKSISYGDPLHRFEHPRVLEEKDKEYYERIGVPQGLPKYVPKDDHFEEEERRERADKIANERKIAEALRKQQEQENEAIRKVIAEKNRQLEREAREAYVLATAKAEDEYQSRVREIEARIRREHESRQIYANQSLPNIRPNSWRPK